MMTQLLIPLLILIFYVVPMVIVWVNLRIIYSPKGTHGYHKMKPDGFDFIITIIPILNLFALIVIGNPYHKSYRKEKRTFLDVFFGVKKK